MLWRKLRTLVAQQWAGMIALFLVLATGTAYALPGSNTVFSDDIVDAQVTAADIGSAAVASDEIKNGTIVSNDVANNALGSGRITDNSLTGADVHDGGLTGTDVANDSLTGTDVAESSLGKVPDADTLDGVDSSQYQRVGLVTAGAADETDPDGFADVIRWPELATIQTDGDADQDNTVRIFNTGNQPITIRHPGGQVTMAPGEVTPVDVSDPTTMLIYSADGARSWLVTCTDILGGPEVRCQGVANRLG